MATTLKDLLGRRAECAVVEQLLAGARAGRSGAIVLRGEAGIGKTALLQHAREMASTDLQVVHASGVESESQFAFAGLHQLCAPMLERAGALSDPQRAALDVALGFRGGAAPNRFLVGLAALTLLSEVADERPLLCIVDDVQWLDQASAQVLAFVARRLVAERVIMLFARRDPGGGHDDDPFAGLPSLRLEGLGDADARALLAAAGHGPLDAGVRDQVVAEARGNPLALMELPRSAEPERLAGGYALPHVLSVPRRIEDSFRRRLRDLPAETQQLLLVAAAEPTGDAALFERAAAHLGLSCSAADSAESAGLLEIDTRVRFAHPLVRSAVYQAATPPDQRQVHGALAAATDSSDPDRRAWHRAQSVLGLDEQVAADLEASAGRARARGGWAAAAAFLQRAAELTPDPVLRTRRTLDAAAAKQDAGAPGAALQLAEVAAGGALDALQGARLNLLRAQISFQLARGSGATATLLDAAATLAPLDPRLSRETYLRAFDAAIVTGGLGSGPDVSQVAEAALAAPAPPGPPRPADLLLDGLVTMYTQGYEAAVPELRAALEAFRTPGAHPEDVDESCRWLWLASRTAMALFDDTLCHGLADLHVRLAREVGALASLPTALLVQSIVLVLSGQLGRAELAGQQTAITTATRALPLLHAQLVLAAWRGRADETTEIRATIEREAHGSAKATEINLSHYAMAVLHNGLGNYAEAADAAARAFRSTALVHSNLAQSELVEAACRAGEPERAADALEQLCSRAAASGTAWGQGLAARSRALVSTGPDAEEHYLEAIKRLRDCRMTSHLARAHLVYGEWLRREGRRQDAREQLRTAHEMLTDIGAEAFAARAARELGATGERPRRRTAQATDALTAQELQVARLVATGATSREVGAQLYLSPRTIEAHLRSIFRKLGITSRRQLREMRLP
ncbi:AAA family ATPase [Aeromicrobium chenweiae]|uniref:LuxR family transcriptional regulator n=1 Tax=Aeromicrobium chenweiae TaxID=2079793 RepID=A0A2S0WP93_9ACTN|nr:LuxR family transcriptional regulator [Aeromicrobium chenweiae]AWB93137.1 LuxR family transcriptional regulator [Aeromicrobium chenweiae]TGN34127.1 helix-turn-helix transcriptional regulator [Aeromicrobium chenweiae]